MIPTNFIYPLLVGAIAVCISVISCSRETTPKDPCSNIADRPKTLWVFMITGEVWNDTDKALVRERKVGLCTLDQNTTVKLTFEYQHSIKIPASQLSIALQAGWEFIHPRDTIKQYNKIIPMVEKSALEKSEEWFGKIQKMEEELESLVSIEAREALKKEIAITQKAADILNREYQQEIDEMYERLNRVKEDLWQLEN